MAGGEEKSRYELLENSDLLTLLVRGEFITSSSRFLVRKKRVYDNAYTWLL